MEAYSHNQLTDYLCRQQLHLLLAAAATALPVCTVREAGAAVML